MSSGTLLRWRLASEQLELAASTVRPAAQPLQVAIRATLDSKHAKYDLAAQNLENEERDKRSRQWRTDGLG